VNGVLKQQIKRAFKFSLLLKMQQ